MAAPQLDYLPPTPTSYRPLIGLIGCGAITEHHLRGYVASGFKVGAFYDPDTDAAEARRAEFYPNAVVCASVQELLAVPGLEVVDIATHPSVRGPLIEQAIAAGKHVLSQKPFVLDLAEGERLVRLADRAGVTLAVNQNARWAPYFAYLRQAVRAGLVGDVGSVMISLNWDHTWMKDTPFEEVRHLILYDFAIHWFDAVASFMGSEPARSVMAALRPAPDQPVRPSLVASSVIAYDSAIATLSFNGFSPFAPRETIVISGTTGTLHAGGAPYTIPSVELTTESGTRTAELTGSWFPDGFRGAMGELLCAIEDGREPENAAADNLRSLAICFASLDSADQGRVVEVGGSW